MDAKVDIGDLELSLKEPDALYVKEFFNEEAKFGLRRKSFLKKEWLDTFTVYRSATDSSFDKKW